MSTTSKNPTAISHSTENKSNIKPRAQCDRTANESQPLVAEGGNRKPPHPPIEVAAGGGMFDPEFIEGYLRGLRDSLATGACGGSDNDSELMRRSR